MYAEIERRSNEKNKNLLEKIITMEEREIQIRNNLDEKETKIGMLEKKYHLCATKGIEFERDIFEYLCELNTHSFDSAWEISHVGNRTGHKGDIILRNKITGIEIMIDPKNHDNVGKKDKDKFLSDMRNPLNLFKAGIMLSRGKIRGMRTYEEIKDGVKHLVFISNYKVGDENFVMTVIERLHNEIHNKSTEKISMSTVKEKYLKEYATIQKQKKMVSTHLNELNAREKELSSDYYDYFNCDIAIRTMEKNDSTIDKSEQLYEWLDDNLIRNSGLKASVVDIKNEICKQIHGVTSKRATQCINTWKKEKFNDTKNVTNRSVLTGYGLKNENTILHVQT
jgi:hypothetical protein